jgi:uncharacterized protein YkwD
VPRLARVTIAFALALVPLARCDAQPVASPDDGVFVALLNESRSQAGLAPLDYDRTLSVRARAHAVRMLERGEIFHSSGVDLQTTAANAWAIGENVGVGSSPAVLHDAFMRSRGHRENILGDFNAVGVGTERDIDGTLYVTVLFLRRSPSPVRSSLATGLAAAPIVRR